MGETSKLAALAGAVTMALMGACSSGDGQGDGPPDGAPDAVDQSAYLAVAGVSDKHHTDSGGVHHVDWYVAVQNKTDEEVEVSMSASVDSWGNAPFTSYPIVFDTDQHHVSCSKSKNDGFAQPIKIYDCGASNGGAITIDAHSTVTIIFEGEITNLTAPSRNAHFCVTSVTFYADVPAQIQGSGWHDECASHDTATST